MHATWLFWQGIGLGVTSFHSSCTVCCVKSLLKLQDTRGACILPRASFSAPSDVVFGRGTCPVDSESTLGTCHHPALAIGISSTWVWQCALMLMGLVILTI